MKIGDRQIFRFFGWNTQGDIGPWTMYTSPRAGLVIFLRAPPRKPFSIVQKFHHQRMKAAGEAWTALSETTKATWELASKRANLRINGYNLWIYHQLSPDPAAIHTIERQTGLTLI